MKISRYEIRYITLTSILFGVLQTQSCLLLFLSGEIADVFHVGLIYRKRIAILIEVKTLMLGKCILHS